MSRQPYLQHQQMVSKQRRVAAAAFEKSLVQRGIVPDTSKLILNRVRLPLAVIGAVLLAMLVGVTTLLFNFILFNQLIHI